MEAARRNKLFVFRCVYLKSKAYLSVQILKLKHFRLKQNPQDKNTDKF